MASERLLLVDDDNWLLESMSQWLTEQGYRVTTARTVAQARKLAGQAAFDVCLADICLEGEDGFGLLQWSRQHQPELPVVMMTGYGGPDSGAEAVAAGAFDLLTKPIIDQELLTTLRRAMDQKRVVAENRQLKEQLDRRSGLENILSHDPRMLEIFDIIDSVADTKATILITGENGTGKSMIARSIHRRSSRRARPFVEVACGALPDNLLESELFGHTEGAFTGATQSKAGKFEHAHTGTIFLDEIGTASMSLQIKLLRVLQEFEFEPVGGNKTISVDTRCILATNEDLSAAVETGKFRQDLYYRVNVIHFELPALRQRAGDIPVLIEHFLQKNLAELPKEIQGFSAEALEILLNYAWPGNIRELENIVQRAVLLSKRPVIGPELLPNNVLASVGDRGTRVHCGLVAGQSLRQALEGPERAIILEVLRANAFSRSLTADQLGINRTTLYKKMKRLGIDDLSCKD
ncbi:MAG: sigma-54-dependent Fis family transcriptional regulator [Pirellulaceae bacterium]|nr:sigma-54-dependent Fis family transcriptional regulator [Pirellulaceae bacterium]